MGLDITGYAGLEKTDQRFDPQEQDFDYTKYVSFYKESGRLDRAEEIDTTVLYSFQKRVNFTAGSYGGYNEWRNELAKMVGNTSARAVWEDPQPGPFMELIDFSDCEGTIGTRISAKLAKDFLDNKDKAQEWAVKLAKRLHNPDEGNWFLTKYDQWYGAFKLASDRGAVKFH